MFFFVVVIVVGINLTLISQIIFFTGCKEFKKNNAAKLLIIYSTTFIAENYKNYLPEIE